MRGSPKAESVTKEGEPDGWSPPAAFAGQVDDDGGPRLLVSTPMPWLRTVHRDLVRSLGSPIGVLYRQKVDRQKPAPNGSPPRDFVALDVPVEVALAALEECADLVYSDARCELWLRGVRGGQIVLDADGLVYSYPDDPSFRDVCRGNGLVEGPAPTLLERDYVKHWYHAENDALEAGFLEGLGCAEVPYRR